jgi:Fic family protein
MRPPKKPPDFNKLIAGRLTSVINRLGDADVAEYQQRANFHYRHWEDLRFVPPPKSLTPADAWLAVKLSRSGQQRKLPLTDEKSVPFGFWLPDSALQSLHEVDQGAGGNLIADGRHTAFLSEAKDQVIISSLMEEAIATSQLEGAVTTRDRAKELLRSKRKPRDKSEQMITNSYNTITMLRSVADRPLSLELLSTIHRSITEGTLDDPEKAGAFRTTADQIVIKDDRSDAILFVPPDADQLTERVSKLISFANEEPSDAAFVHPLVKAAIIHFWLAYEHPYVDGNGRTARALFYWYMLKHQYWLFEYLTISKIVYQAPMQYYRSFLYSEHDGNDLTYSIVFMLRVTKMAIRHLKKTLREKMLENERLVQVLRDFPGLNYRQQTLLSNALKSRNQVYTIANHQSSHGVSYQTARTDLLDLVKRKLLFLSRSGKQLVFLPAEDLPSKLSRGRKGSQLALI